LLHRRAGNHADLYLESADLRQIARVGAELVPVALVRQGDQRIEIRLLHLAANKTVAAVSLGN
jgi:hypothetical protein